MHHYSFTIKANRRPETLERLLRVVRHRGFEVVTLNAENQGNVFCLHLTVQSERAFNLLTSQLIKLPDVIELN